MKKETLEEAAKRLQKDKYGIFISKDIDVKGQLVIDTANAAFLSGMIEGAKWQQERSYTEKEVKELLETQRGNCYVALLSHTKNDDIASIALQAPEPGGKNGTWIK